MNSSTLQFAVAGALIAAWAWMLGRPLLTNFFRRSRRDSVGHFRYQQAVLGRPLDQDQTSRPSRTATVVRPMRAWWRQPLERRRLQLMLGFSLATFSSLLLAIALRGPAVRLFLIMVCFFVAYMAYAALVGAAQLRKAQLAITAETAVNTRSHQRAPQPIATRRSTETTVERSAAQLVDELAAVDFLDQGSPTFADTSRKEPEFSGAEEPIAEFDSELEHHPEPAAETQRYGDEAEADELEERGVFGTGVFDEDFFEPIPELQFAPLNLDASLIQPADEVGAAVTAAGWDHGIIDEPAADDEGFADEGFADEATDTARTDAEFDFGTGESAGMTDQQESVAPLKEQRAEPSFTAPPVQRPRPNRKKARPIYIESQLDEQDQQEQRVVND